MEQDNRLNEHDTIWHFSVTDPRLHTKGFTVYKVTCKNYPVKSPEKITELVCWKRYNCIKVLYDSLMALHKVQHRHDPFPEFARPVLFGRFTESVIENRRQSTVKLLNFISTQPHLYKSAIFKDFLEEGRIPSDFNKRGSLLSSKSSSISSASNSLKVDVNPGSSIGVNQTEVKVDGGTLPAGMLQNGNTEAAAKLLRGKVDFRSSSKERTLLEGTWNFPQMADNISLGSSTGDETVDTDDESALDGSLPDTDLASFSPLRSDYPKPASDGVNRDISRNASWLMEGLNMCADLGSNSKPMQESANIFKESALGTESAASKESSISFSVLDNCQRDTITSNTSAATGKASDLEEDDLIRRMSQSSVYSKTECGRGDLDLSVELQSGRSSSFGSDVLTGVGRLKSTSSSQAKEKTHSDPTLRTCVGSSVSSQNVGLNSSLDSLRRKPTQKLTGSFLKSLVSGNPILPRQRSMTEQSISTMSIGGKEDYIYQAANQISKAQNREANGDYEVAFAYYKSGVGILLHGVQSDTNKFRRDAVRKKTAKYLMKAEDLFNRHLANDCVGELRWGTENFLSPSVDPSFAFIRGSAKELRNFQVLAIIDRVILVRHKLTDETFVIKSISKSSLDTGSTQSVLPTSCPYMVSLHRFYETEDSVFLLLEYASGGKLWTYIEGYLKSTRSSSVKLALDKSVTKTESTHVYCGMRLKSSSNEENGLEDRSKLNFVVKENDTISSDLGSNLEGAEALESDYLLRYSMLDRNVGETSAVNELLVGSRSNHSEHFKVAKTTPVEDHPNIHQVSDFSDVLNCSQRTQALDRRLSSLSNDCPSVGEQESSVISPISLSEDSFQCLLLENNTDCEAFSINSVNSEDTNHNSSSCENVCNIPTNAHSTSFPIHETFKPSKADKALSVTMEDRLSKVSQDNQQPHENLSSNFTRKCDSPFSSEDIIRKSKELLTQVDKVLAETNNRTENSWNNLCDDPQLKPLFPTSSKNSQGHTGNNDSSLVVRVGDENERTFVSSLADTHNWCSSPNDTDVSDFVNGSDKNAKKTCINDLDIQTNILLSAKTTESVALNAVTENENKKNCNRVIARNNSSPFGQTSTPRKLSMSHMTYKGITRSASFECDFRSPARSRSTTASYLLKQLNSTSIAPAQIPESCIRKWMAQMVTAVSRLHSLGVVCRDLKPSNILLGDGGQVYLTYFCKLGHNDQGLDWDAKENLYAAPEVGSVNRYDRSCDWWSIGAILYELVVGRSLGECHPGGINTHTCLHIPMFVPSETKGLLEGLLRHNPNERLGAGIAGSEEIKAHPFFAGVDWHTLEYS